MDGSRANLLSGQINELEETDYLEENVVARRLLERGFKFVQIWSGNDNGFPAGNWDSHEHPSGSWPIALGMARGTAALVADLKQRGCLRTRSFYGRLGGRMPCAQEAGEITIPSASPTGLWGGHSWGVTHGLSDEWAKPGIVITQPRSTTSTRPFFTCLGFDTIG